VKIWLHIVIALCFQGCLLAPPTPPKVLGNTETSVLIGEWQTLNDSDLYSFSLRVWQSRDSLYGAYCAIVDDALDCADPKSDYVSFATLNPFEQGILETPFSCYHNADTGRVRLRLIQEELYWEMLQFPRRGQCLAPKQTVLYKVGRR
jgi:hypothetical protein